MTGTDLKTTIGEVAAMRLALSVTRFWAIELVKELEAWVEFAEAGGDHHPRARTLLEQWKKQSEILNELVSLDSDPGPHKDTRP